MAHGFPFAEAARRVTFQGTKAKPIPAAAKIFAKGMVDRTGGKA
jgi:hypothetical protein